jgi:hypothetical protein
MYYYGLLFTTDFKFVHNQRLSINLLIEILDFVQEAERSVFDLGGRDIPFPAVPSGAGVS